MALNYPKWKKRLEELKYEDPDVTVVEDEKGKKVTNTKEIDLPLYQSINRMQQQNTYTPSKTIKNLTSSPVEIKTSKEKDEDDDKKWYQKLLQLPEVYKDDFDLFDDGYDFGDGIRTGGRLVASTIGTILGSTADAGLGVVKGITRVGEDIGALGSGLIAQGADIIGADDYADKVRKNIAQGKHRVLSNIIDKGQEAIDGASIFGDTGDSVTEGVGQLGAFYVTGGAGMFGSGAGGSLEQSYQKEDVEDWQVWTKAVGTGAISWATERLGGFLAKGTPVDEIAANKISQKISNGMLKVLTRSTLSASAEAGEEALEYAGDYLLNHGIDKLNEITGGKGAEFKEDWDWEAFGEQMAIGFLTSKAASTGINVSNIASTKVNNNISTKEAINEVAKQQDRQAGMLTKSEQQALDSIVNERVNEIKKQNTLENELKNAITSRETSQGGILSDKNKNALRDSILTKIENGEIDISSTKVNKKELSKIQEEVKKNLSEGNYDLSKLEDILTPTETAQIKELEQTLANTKDNAQKAEIQAKIKELKTSKLNSLKNMVNDNQYLNKAVYETEMSNQQYTYDESKVTDEYEKDTRESAKTHLNNNTVSRNFVDNIAKLAKDRQTHYKFTNNKELLEQGDLVENTNLTKEEKNLIQKLEKQLEEATTEQQKKNIQRQIDEIKYLDVGGFVRKNVDGVETVLINVDSKQSLNAVVGHETKHLLEKNSLNKDYNKLLFEYAKSKGDYDTYKERIERLYEGIDNANIENELSAALTGDYLFTDSKFIETLLNDTNTNTPKIIQKIKELIDDLVVRFKGTKEERQLREVQKKFKELYKQKASTENVATDGTIETKYMVTGYKGHKQLAKELDNQKFKNNYKKAVTMSKNNATAKDIREQTGWYKDVNNDWKFEISDKYSKINENVKLEKNGRYTVKDILDHEILYKMYPNLAKTKVIFTDMKQRGRINKITGTLYLNNNLINNETQLKKTLLHEIQHNIQRKEGFQGGTSVAAQDGIYERYENNFGETEARETSERMEMTFDERVNNPSYTSTYRKGQPGTKLYTKEDKRWYNFPGGSHEEVNTKNREANQGKNRSDDILGLNEELDDSSFFDGKNEYSLSDINNHKQQQLDIILKENPMTDDYHTGIRTIEDIKTFDETINDDESFVWGDFSQEDAKKALDKGEITVYSSYPIEQGVFVSTSKNQAQDYAGSGKIYSKTVPLSEVAWINGDEGQYAKVSESKLSLSSQNEDMAPVGDYNVYGRDIKYYDLPFDDNTSIYSDSLEGVERELGNTLDNTLPEEQTDKPTSAREWKEKAKQRTVEQKVEDTIRKQSYKNAASTSMLGRRMLNFNEQERRTFRDSLLGLTTKTKEQLINADAYNDVRNIINQYANREFNYIDEDLADAKREVRKYKIKLGDYLKKQITDYNDFRKSNFGNLTFSKDGQAIDTIWQELNEQYPYYFSEDIVAEADMIYALSEFMQKDVTITEKYRLSDEDIEGFTKKVYNKIVENSLSQQDLDSLEQDLTDQVERRTRQVVQNELLEEMGITDDVLMNAKKINQIDLQRTDPIRVNEKIFGWKNGQIINDATINTTIKHEAERIRFLNQERDDIRALGIKPRSAESAAVQKYGEKEYVNDKGEVVAYGDKELASEFSDEATQAKIKRAAQILRSKYDTYIEVVNNELERMGYDPIPKRKNYMRHFQEMTDIFSQLGTPLNPTSLNENNLPTDINGLTDEFKPGKSWFANAQQRKGMKTVYDAITGIDGYLDSVSNVIYHTEDIQRYRTLAKHIRTMFSDKALEDYDVLRDDEKIEALDRAFKGQDGYLSQYVAWLDEQANALAGKKGKIDRGVEELFGRKVYTVLDTAKKQVGSNMTGFNVRSAMTNFASVVQGMSKTKKAAFLKGTISTFQNIAHDDGLINKSNFLTTRFGSEQLSKKMWQKVSNYGQIFMTGTDYFTANQIWRSKYFENLDSGMSEDAAIKNADDFAARVMGNRAKGTTAQIFNSKTLGLFTQFQLEVNNQWSSMIHDNKMEIEKGQLEGKTGKATASVIFNLGQLAVFSNVFNALMKSLTGSDVMFDPIELFKSIIGGDDEEEEDISKRISKALGEVVDDIPFANIVTGGGRIPIAEAFEGPMTLLKKMTGQTDEYGNEYTDEDVWKALLESGAYWIMPTGYGQIRKTYQGLKMYDDDLPVAGSYTNSGNLRFTADEDLSSKIKAGLFGQYASDEAQAYIDSGFKSIHKNSIEELVDLDMVSSEYRTLKSNINAAGRKNKEKVNYIADLDELTNTQKNILVNNILKREYDVDVSNYDDYGSYEAFDYSYRYPEQYAIARTVTDDIVEYKKFISDINDIKADKTVDGKTISGSRQKKIVSYVNSLDLTIPQKAILIKQVYSSFNDYNRQIIEYINSLDIEYEEKMSILKSLNMKVKSSGYVSW